MNILVTGGAGFIGSNLVDKLIDLGHDVSIIDNLSTGKLENINKKAKLYIVDIEEKVISKIFKIGKFDIVYHLAAQIDVQKSILDPAYDADVNIIGTINVVNNCANYGVKKIVYSSSAAIYGEPKYLPIDEKHESKPISYYGMSKYIGEEYIKLHSKNSNLDYTILRYANVYGPRQDPKGEGGVVSIFLGKLLNNENINIFGDGNATRDFIYVEDIVYANISAMNNGAESVFNIGTGVYTSVNKLADIMINKINPKLTKIYKEEREGDIKTSYFNVDKAEKLLDWKAKYTVDEGLNKTIDYYTK